MIPILQLCIVSLIITILWELKRLKCYIDDNSYTAANSALEAGDVIHSVWLQTTNKLPDSLILFVYEACNAIACHVSSVTRSEFF